MRVLVTGGAGFIGSHFVDFLLGDPKCSQVSKVVVLDALTYAGNLANLETARNDPRFEFVLGDICDDQVLRQLIPEVDALVNFAAESHVDNSINSSIPFVRTNVLGVAQLLSISRECGLPRFVQVSTDEVYGSILTGSWKEDFPLNPNSPYAASKAGADLLCLSEFRTYGSNISITRCSNNYGPRQHPEKLIPSFISKIIQGKNVPLYGDGKNVREWIHVQDHCAGIWSVLTRGVPGEIYNIGSGEEKTNFEITRLLLESFGLPENRIDYVADRLGHDRRYSISFEKIETELGYQPSILFSEGIGETVSWYKLNFDRWVRPLLAK
jgi:dTDP-glucose 4,6-dehydratase